MVDTVPPKYCITEDGLPLDLYTFLCVYTDKIRSVSVDSIQIYLISMMCGFVIGWNLDMMIWSILPAEPVFLSPSTSDPQASE